MKTSITAFLFLLLTIAFINPAFSNDCPTINKLADAHKILNISEDTSVKGKVLNVVEENYSGMDEGACRSLVLMLKDSVREFLAYMGPERFLKNRDIQFAIGETIEIMGSMARVDGKEIMIARSVNYRDQVLVLRNEDGTMAIRQ